MAKTKLQRLKSCRPSPGHLEINEWIRSQQVRLGLDTGGIPPVNPQPTVTVYPGPVVIEHMAHYGADLLIANNPGYDSMCARLDAELAEISDGSVGLAATRAKSTRAQRVPSVMTND